MVWCSVKHRDSFNYWFKCSTQFRYGEFTITKDGWFFCPPYLYFGAQTFDEKLVVLLRTAKLIVD
jgi:hypothetical protein